MPRSRIVDKIPAAYQSRIPPDCANPPVQINGSACVNGKAIRLQFPKHCACRCGFAGVRELTTRRQCRICKPGGLTGENPGQVPERVRREIERTIARMKLAMMASHTLPIAAICRSYWCRNTGGANCTHGFDSDGWIIARWAYGLQE